MEISTKNTHILSGHLPSYMYRWDFQKYEAFAQVSCSNIVILAPKLSLSKIWLLEHMFIVIHKSM